MNLEILSARDAGTRTFPYHYAHIAISCPVCQGDDPVSDDPNRMALLRVYFHDHRDPHPPVRPEGNEEERRFALTHPPPKAEDIAGVVPFVNEWKDKVDGFVVNCGAGMSRSAGLAAGICPLIGVDEAICFQEPRNPNLWVKQLIREAMG